MGRMCLKITSPNAAQLLTQERPNYKNSQKTVAKIGRNPYFYSVYEETHIQTTKNKKQTL